MKLFFLFFILCINFNQYKNLDEINENVIKTEINKWSTSFSNDLYKLNMRRTCFDRIYKEYGQMGAKVSDIDGHQILREFINDIQLMFKWKRDHVERIAAAAEEAAKNYVYEESMVYYDYNSKKLYNPAMDEDKISEMQKNLVAFSELKGPEKINEMNKWHEMSLTPNTVYRGTAVNLNHSAVHIPVNVFNEKPSIMNSLKWSSTLTQKFKNNKNLDTDLSWQFFCADEGYLRLYPAAKWRIPEYLSAEEDQVPLDLYDCRLRTWYTKAASSPKDVVILLDRSGSMTGQREDISKNVVMNILESLTEDDYVQLLGFSNNVTRFVDCFGNRLVIANKQNIRIFKESLSKLKTFEIANFTLALTEAFEILESGRKVNQSTNCNQAIMLVTDGAPEDYHAFFEQYNGPKDVYGNDRIQTRVFTFLVGKEVTDTKEVHSMACQNRGFYTHVANMAEVREKVQQYIPVMSRPIVLSKKRPFIYTSVYTDVTDVPLLYWVWDGRERERIRENILKNSRRLRNDYNIPTPDEENKEIEENETNQIENEMNEKINELDNNIDETDIDNSSSIVISTLSSSSSSSVETDDVKNSLDEYKITDSSETSIKNVDNKPINELPQKKSKKRRKKSVDSFAYPLVEHSGVPGEGIHDLMLTIAAPVLDLKNSSNITERYVAKNIQRKRVVEVRSANLLGVAGVDVPIRQIVRYAPSFKLRVNGYSFAINNNGHILYHPDLRPLFQDLIKPFYNAIDLVEVELENDNNQARVFENAVQKMRGLMLKRVPNKSKIDVKIHIDSMKRVLTRTNTYFYDKIDESPFVLGISLPEPYGLYEIIAKIDFNTDSRNFEPYFEKDNWRVHPEWVYCTDNVQNIEFDEQPRAPEEVIKMLVKKFSEGHRPHWRTPSLNPPANKDRKIICEKELIQNLIFDAKVTNVDFKWCGQQEVYDGGQMMAPSGIALTFIATRSGFTRYQDHRSDEEKSNVTTEEIFANVYNRATDEIFYQRAVEYYRHNASAFIYSVPFDIGEGDGFVLAAKAIFLGNGSKKAPAAVTGQLLKINEFSQMFFDHHKLCSGKNGANCNIDCFNGHFNCYLVDNNGFVIVSANNYENGKFFGEINNNLLNVLVENGFYKRITMFDYQAICIQNVKESNVAFILRNPLNAIINFSLWFLTKISLILSDFYLMLSSNIALTSSQSSSSSAAAGSTASREYYNDYDTDYPPNGDMYNEEEKGRRRIAPNRTKPYPCDKQFDLYEMPSILSSETFSGLYNRCPECQEKYFLQQIPFSNMILLVNQVDCPCQTEIKKMLPNEITYSNSCEIHRQHLDMHRIPPNIPCFNVHPEEKEVKLCGKACYIKLSKFLFILLLLKLFVLN